MAKGKPSLVWANGVQAVDMKPDSVAVITTRGPDGEDAFVCIEFTAEEWREIMEATRGVWGVSGG